MPDSSIKDNNCDFVFFASLFVEDDDDDDVVVCFRLLLVAAFVDVDAMSTMSDFNDDDDDVVVPSSPSVFSFGLRNNNRPVESTHFRSSSARTTGKDQSSKRLTMNYSSH